MSIAIVALTMANLPAASIAVHTRPGREALNGGVRLARLGRA
jgi:hypothetical protein